jgi:hypothetical protein
VHPQARFCNYCGKPIEPPNADTLPAETVVADSQDTLRVNAPVAPPDSRAIPQTVPAPETKTAASGAPRKAPRQGLYLVAALGLVMVCGLLAITGYFAARRLGWLGSQTPLAALPTQPTEQPARESSTQAPPTETASPTATSTRPAPTPTSPAQPTPSPEQSPAQEIIPTEAQASLPTPGVVLFEDPFDGSLREHWVSWGEPRATIGSGFGDNWLYLKAIDPGQAGVTTRPEFFFSNAPGVEIEFDAQMDEKYPQAALILDWDPTTFDRGPENREEGILRLEIRLKQIKLYGRATREVCEQAIASAASHTYLLRLTEGQGVALFLDGAEQPICQLASMELPPELGKLSFSGLGWVSRVKVTLPQ